MKKQIDAVKDFHDAFLQSNAHTPTLLDVDTFHLRYRLMEEENVEYVEACINEDLTGIADALGDQLYILCGTILKHGLQHKIEEIFDEIHRSNMSKLGPDGKPIHREDGKILKGPDYFKPDISKFLKD